MPLFQNSVVTKQLQSQDKNKLVAQWNVFRNHFHNPAIQENIRNSKEEQYQGEFLIDLFVNVLGYTKNPTPNFTITTEYKNVKDSKKADGAILVPSLPMGLNPSLPMGLNPLENPLGNPLEKPLVKAVIELKGTNTTDLNKIEVQAFGYKNNQPDCVYVITSNFEKLRFYIDNATEHIEFNLFYLTEKEFELLYLCLAYENIANDIPKKLKEQSVSQEKDITKKLYSDYSLFKRELHQDLVNQNPDFDALELFQKSQKLLDRFLFIFFAEDRNLLPTNLIFRINKEWRQLQEMRMNISLYDRYKIYFNDLNKGAKVILPAFSETISLQKEEHQIFAYNGGLFQPDTILDTIKIDDELLYKHTQKISHYDFQSEVDVNILGHIFENSLNELDELTNQAMASTMGSTMGLNPLAKAQTKRKKDGVFYTPKYITKYIVDNTIGKLCIDKKEELNIIEEEFISNKGLNKGLKPLGIAKKTKQELFEKLTTYRNWLLQITICDPACGSGAFLNQALDFLIAEHGYIDELQAKLFGDGLILSDVEKSILENNLFGVDLNEESVEIAKLSLWLRTAQPNRKLNDLNNNIKCGNSLIDDVAIAGEKAFNWQTAFPQVFKEKQKKAYHFVFTTHNSRISQRMIDFKIMKGPALELNLKEEIELTKIFKQIILENQYKCLAYNICKDHVHIIIVCEEEEVNTIAKTLKGKSSYLYQSNGFKPIGEPLWSQKFFFANLNELIWSDISPRPGHIASDTYLENAINYIKTNRDKHQLTDSKELKNSIKDFVVDLDIAFANQYKGGFDVIIGNPPYGVNFNDIEKKYLSNFDNLVPDFEIYIYFISLYKSILREKGLLSYIFPNTFLSTLFGKKYREEIFNNVDVYQIVDLSNDITFTDASVRTCIFSFRNVNAEYVTELVKINNFEFKTVGKYLKNNIISEIENISSLFFQNKDEKVLIDKLQKNKYLKEFHEVSQGLIPYDKYRGHDEFTIKNRIWHSDSKKDETYKKELKGGDVNRYDITWNGNLWISYGDWLAAPRNPLFFTKERVLVREIISKKLFCGYTNEEFYNTPSCINIIDTKSIINLKVTLTLLNSRLIGWYCNKVSPKANKGLFPKILVNDIRNIPLVEVKYENQASFIEKADLMLALNKDLQEQSQKFQRTIKRKFFSTTPMGLNPLENTSMLKPLENTMLNPLEVNLPKKLQDWYLLSYNDFIKELSKQKIKLTLSQEAEWEDYFTTEAKKVYAIKTQIETTDKAIDAMVYELYGLTQEEIKIIDES